MCFSQRFKDDAEIDKFLKFKDCRIKGLYIGEYIKLCQDISNFRNYVWIHSKNTASIFKNEEEIKSSPEYICIDWIPIAEMILEYFETLLISLNVKYESKFFKNEKIKIINNFKFFDLKEMCIRVENEVIKYIEENK